MDPITVFLLIILVAVPPTVVFLTVRTLIQKYLNAQYQMQIAGEKERNRNITLPLQLQAYERLSLYCERISIPALVLRLREEGMSAKQLRAALLIAIQQEYEHNITQQVYVSAKLWEIIKIARDNTVNAINTVAEGQSADADGRAFGRALLSVAPQVDQSLATALAAIKQETKMLF